MVTRSGTTKVSQPTGRAGVRAPSRRSEPEVGRDPVERMLEGSAVDAIAFHKKLYDGVVEQFRDREFLDRRRLQGVPVSCTRRG